MALSLKQEQAIEIKDEISFLDTQIANLERRLKEARSRRSKLWANYYELTEKTSKKKGRKPNDVVGISDDDILELIKNRASNVVTT